MKKILLFTILVVIGFGVSAQHLYVQPIGSEQVAFAFEHKPKITFGNGTKTIQTTSQNETFLLSNIQNLSFKFNAPTSNVPNFAETNNILIFPNPVKNELTLIVENLTPNTSYRIFDMSGKLQKTNQIVSETTQIQMQNFRSGTYILHIVCNNQTIQSFKILKQ
jgi:hypothetical protein